MDHLERIKELEEQLTVANTAKVTAEKTVLEVNEAYKNLASEKAAAVSTVKEQAAEIEDLKSQVKKLQKDSGKPVMPDPVDLDGVVVKFNFPKFKFNGNSYTAEEAATSKPLMKEILATKGQGILTVVH